MKIRRHHNNYGKRTVKTGKCADQLKRIAERMKVPFAVGKQKPKVERHDLTR